MRKKAKKKVVQEIAKVDYEQLTKPLKSQQSVQKDKADVGLVARSDTHKKNVSHSLVGEVQSFQFSKNRVNSLDVTTNSGNIQEPATTKVPP
jgi:hypothetical protein